jgi:hypothetical protein
MTIPEVPPIPGNPVDPDVPEQPAPGGEDTTARIVYVESPSYTGSGDVQGGEELLDAATREQDEKDATKQDEKDATKHAGADREPTAEEATAAEEAERELEGDVGSVAEHYEEMSHLGAEVKGEGEI